MKHSRQDYVDGKCSYDEYYSQFIDRRAAVPSDPANTKPEDTGSVAPVEGETH